MRRDIYATHLSGTGCSRGLVHRLARQKWTRHTADNTSSVTHPLFMCENLRKRKILDGKIKTNFLIYRSVYGLGVPYTVPLDNPENVLAVKRIHKKGG